MTGWRVGFVCGNADAIKALGTIKNNIDSGTFKAIQDAATAAFTVDAKYINDLNKMYQERRDAAEEGFRELGWNVKPSKATFYLWLPVPKGMSSEEFVTIMLEIKECIRRMKEAGIRYN